jgi:heme exporter protein A
MLKVNNLSCFADRLLFEHLCFELNTSQVLHIQGDNGAGKTTLLHCLQGVHAFEKGEIEWFGEPIDRIQSVLGYDVFFQGVQLALKLNLTPMESILLWYRTLCHSDQDNSNSAGLNTTLQSLLSRMNIPLDHRLNSQLSSGQQRRLTLVKLAITDAKVWILDEPYACLDTQGVTLLNGLIDEHLDRDGSVIMTSHQSLTLNHPITALKL